MNTTLSIRIVLSLVALSLSTAAGCTTTEASEPSSSDGKRSSDDDDDDDSSSGGSSSGGSSDRTGVTPCGTFGGSAKSCQAGQYCSDETLSKCDSGCLSNTNCASDQTCKKGDGNVGNCVNVPTTGVGAQVGATCKGDDDCKSNVCLLPDGNSSGICSQPCNLVTDCPGGYTAWEECGAFPKRTGQFCLPK